MEVTLVKVVDPAQSAKQFLQPTPGMREIALELRYKNVGSTTYSQSVLGDVTVIDEASHSYSSEFENTTAGTFPGLPGFPFGLVNIAPGESTDGFATFQIPQRTPVTGEADWRSRRRRPRRRHGRVAGPVTARSNRTAARVRATRWGWSGSSP